jgi:hypothetical protein
MTSPLPRLTEEQTKLPQKTVSELLEDARESISLLSCQMQTVMTDGSKGDKYQAVSMRLVNTWFNILDKNLEKKVALAISAERERLLTELKQRVYINPITLKGTHIDWTDVKEIFSALKESNK